MSGIVEKVSIELTSGELGELLVALKLNIFEETKKLYQASERSTVEAEAVFDRFLASINRKTELCDKLQKALYGGEDNIIYSNGNL